MPVEFETTADWIAPLREALWEAIIDTLPPSAARGPSPGELGAKGWRGIGREVLRLHQAYTTGGGSFRHERNPIHGAQAGYQLYFLPRNLIRVLRVISGLPWRDAGQPAIPPRWLRGRDGNRVLSLLDLGCGSGAFSLAWLSWLAGGHWHAADAPQIRLTLVDQGSTLLALAERNLRAFARRALPGARLHITTRADGVERYLNDTRNDGPFAVAGGAMMLNELALLGPRRTAPRVQRFALPLRRRVMEGGLIVLVEPGTRKGYMNLMPVRDYLAALPILYPCTHGGSCPFWKRRVDSWCHATLPLPDAFCFDPELKRWGGLEFDMAEVNSAALALQVNSNGRIGAPFANRGGVRVVSAPLPPRKSRSLKKQGKTANTGRGGKADGGGGRGKTEQKQDHGVSMAPVVLVCGPPGRLRERPMPESGVWRRGIWLPHPAGGKGGK